MKNKKFIETYNNNSPDESAKERMLKTAIEKSTKAEKTEMSFARKNFAAIASAAAAICLLCAGIWFSLDSNSDIISDDVLNTEAPDATAEPAATIPEPETATAEPPATIPEPETTATEPEETLPAPEPQPTEPAETVPEPAETIPEPAETLPEPKATAPAETTPQPPATTAPVKDINSGSMRAFTREMNTRYAWGNVYLAAGEWLVGTDERPMNNPLTIECLQQFEAFVIEYQAHNIVRNNQMSLMFKFVTDERANPNGGDTIRVQEAYMPNLWHQWGPGNYLDIPGNSHDLFDLPFTHYIKPEGTMVVPVSHILDVMIPAGGLYVQNFGIGFRDQYSDSSITTWINFDEETGQDPNVLVDVISIRLVKTMPQGDFNSKVDWDRFLPNGAVWDVWNIYWGNEFKERIF